MVVAAHRDGYGKGCEDREGGAWSVTGEGLRISLSWWTSHGETESRK